MKNKFEFDEKDEYRKRKEKGKKDVEGNENSSKDLFVSSTTIWTSILSKVMEIKMNELKM